MAAADVGKAEKNRTVFIGGLRAPYSAIPARQSAEVR